MRTRLRAPIPAPSWLNIVRLASVVLLLGLVSACQTSDQGTSDDAAANANQSAQDSQGGQNSDGGENGEADSSDDTALPGGPIHGLAGVPDYMVKGEPDAEVTMYEWSDYQ